MKPERDTVQTAQTVAARPELRGLNRADVERRIAECRAAGLYSAANALERSLRRD